MFIQIQRIERRGRNRLRGTVAGFLCMMGLSVVILDLADVRPMDAAEVTGKIGAAVRTSSLPA